MRFPNGDMIDIKNDASNMYYIAINDNKDNMQSIEKKLESINTKNTNLLEEIQSREETSVIIGYDYKLECNLSTDKSWEMKTTPKI